MGSSRWSGADWASYSSTTSTKATADIFKSSSMKDEYNPAKIDVRESRDSVVNPESTAIIIASDCTGSMGSIADNLIRKGIGVVFEELLSRRPITDPHLMVMGVGDVTCDRAPLQCTQFEADIKIAEQLEEIFIEHGGGGNSWESYNLPWHFAANKTEIDCFEKRGKKGYLFTIGDEETPENLNGNQLAKVYGNSDWEGVSNAELLTQVSRKYEVYHIIIAEGSHARSNMARVKTAWADLLGQRSIVLDDYTKLSETIVSAIEINEGKDADAVIASWGGDTSIAVASAVGALAPKSKTTDGVVRF